MKLNLLQRGGTILNLQIVAQLNLFLYLILVLGILMGFVRGMKKTLFTFVTMLIFYVVFFLTINPISAFLWQLEMPWLGGLLSNLDPSLSTFASFETNLPQILQVLMGDSITVSAANAELLVLANGIGIFVMKIVYTVLYFTVILLIYKILCMILQAIILGKNKEGESKNRGFGALFGTLNGIMAVFVTLVMMGGVMSVVESMISFTSSNEPVDVSFEFDRLQLNELSYSLIPLASLPEVDVTVSTTMTELKAMVDQYNSNLLVRIADAITVTDALSGEAIPMHLHLFDSVLSFEYHDQVISFRHELAIFSQAISIFLESDFSTSQSLADISGDEIRDAFSILSNSSLLVSILPLAIEVGADYFDQELPITSEALYAMDFETELENLGSIAGTLFDILNGSGLIPGESGGDPIEVDGDMIRDLFLDLSDSSLMILLTETLLVPILEDSEGGLGSMLSIPENLNWETEYVAIGNVFGAVVDAGVSIADLTEADAATLLNAASSIDLTVLLDSQIISSVLINVLSGSTDIEGLSMLVVPNDLIWNDTLDIGGNVIENGELRNLLLAISALNLTDLSNPSTFEISPENIFNADFDIVLSSKIIQATISKLILNNASSDGSGTEAFIIPDYFRETINVGSETSVQIEKVELKAIFSSLETLGITDFSGGMDPSVITSLSDAELNVFLASGSMQITVDNILQDNANILVPTLATENVFNMSNVTTKVEIKAFILAVNQMTSGDISNIQFGLSAIQSLSAGGRNTVLNSMIVRNQITPELEALCEINPLDIYVLTAADYENSSTSNFLLKASIQNIFTHYGI